MDSEAPWNLLDVQYEDAGKEGDELYPTDYESYEEMQGEMIAEIEELLQYICNSLFRISIYMGSNFHRCLKGSVIKS